MESNGVLLHNSLSLGGMLLLKVDCYGEIMFEKECW